VVGPLVGQRLDPIARSLRRDLTGLGFLVRFGPVDTQAHQAQ
jgi:hypothetical protein